MLKFIVVLLGILAFSFAVEEKANKYADNCKPTPTTASGWGAPKKICSGQLIFNENFNTLDKNKWKVLISFNNLDKNILFIHLCLLLESSSAGSYIGWWRRK